MAGGNGGGSAPNQLRFPSDVVLDGAGNLYVADRFNNRIQLFPPNSTSATAGTTLTGPDQVSGPNGLFLDATGNLYVADSNNNRVLKFPKDNRVSITTQPPMSQTVCAGSSVSVPVSISGVASGYQWYKDGSSLGADQQQPTLTLSNVTSTSAGSYVVVITAACSSVTSTAFSLTVNSLPIASLVSSGTLTCAQTSVTLTAGGGTSYSFSGPGISNANAQSGTALATTQGTYSVTVTSAGGCTAVASTTVSSNTSLPAPNLQVSASTSSQPISVTASGCSGTLNWLPQGGTGTSSGNIYTFTAPGSYTLSATCTVGSCTSPASAPVMLQILPGGFAITSVSMVNCQLINAASGQYQVSFTPQYSGQNSNPISFSVVNEKSPTTDPAPYTLRLYTDNPAITLVADQMGNPEARYRFEWLAACQAGSTSNQPPTTTGIPDQTLLQNQPYQLQLTNYFSDPDGQSLTFTQTGLPAGLSLTGSLISGAPSLSGVSSVQIIAIDPGGLSVQTTFQLTVNATPTTPTGFTITGVSTVSCEVISAGERRLTFNPQYGGVSGAPISFSVVNEKLPTTDPGPYSLNLYTDNPAITLSAQQGSSVATYRYNWLAVCNANSRVGAPEAVTGLQVSVLGNPVEGHSAELEIRGVTGQWVQLNLVDLQGRLVHQHRIEQASELERVSLPLGGSKGLLLLQVSTTSERQQLKLLNH